MLTARTQLCLAFYLVCTMTQKQQAVPNRANNVMAVVIRVALLSIGTTVVPHTRKSYLGSSKQAVPNEPVAHTNHICALSYIAPWYDME